MSRRCKHNCHWGYLGGISHHLDHVFKEKGLREEKATFFSVFLYRNLSKGEILFSFNMRQLVFVLSLGFIFISVQSIKTKLVGEGVRNESGMCRSAHPTQSLHFWKEHVPDTDFRGLLSFKSCYFNFKCSCSWKTIQIVPAGSGLGSQFCWNRRHKICRVAAAKLCPFSSIFAANVPLLRWLQVRIGLEHAGLQTTMLVWKQWDVLVFLA